MKRRTVDSTLLRGVGYDAERQVLELELTNGAVYEYQDVPELVYRRFLAAPSLGAFYNSQIRDTYANQRVQRPARAERPSLPKATE